MKFRHSESLANVSAATLTNTKHNSAVNAGITINVINQLVLLVYRHFRSIVIFNIDQNNGSTTGNSDICGVSSSAASTNIKAKRQIFLQN
ncbi:MAG: hypothetical protein CMK92_04700 [Pseudomonas sp.]|nr:hypothetical protein [Pseudomonas sp.]